MHGKPLRSGDSFFNSAASITTVSTNVSHLTNQSSLLFLLSFFVYLLLRELVSTNSVALSSPLQTNATHNSSIRSDEGEMLEASAHVFQTFYGGEIEIISASVDKRNSCFMITKAGGLSLKYIQKRLEIWGKNSKDNFPLHHLVRISRLDDAFWKILELTESPVSS